MIINMKPKATTTKKESAPAQNHYYKVPVDSETGKLITRFWHACQKCEKAAETYCKHFGAQYYYSDPNYFAGGVACVSFKEGEKVNEKEWRKMGDFEGIAYYLPAVEAVKTEVKIPSRDYELKDSWDTIYLRDRIREVTMLDGEGNEEKQLVIPKVCFRPVGEQLDPQGRVVQASRKMRRAIMAEQKRLRLPVMSVQQLYRILGAIIPEGRLADVTPTFFLRSTTYYIGCPYPCGAKGLKTITQAQYHMNQCYAIREAEKKEN